MAIKVLPNELVSNEERLGRFEREARSLAALNHPNIATIHGFEQDVGAPFLVMELVDGEDLSDRIARGPIPVDEAIPLFLQIAEALEAAHDRGIVHRDLKPANIKVADDGRAKILDFGLAKAMEAELPEPELTNSPTLTANETRAGVLMGTAAYMSPEQAKGQSVDKRTDIWSFGVCLYEALTARRPFLGDSATDVLAAILRDEPDLGLLPSTLPSSVARLISRCLRKDPRMRTRDAGELRIELTDSLSQPPSEEHTRGSRTPSWAVGALALALGVAAGVLISNLWRPDASTGRGPLRFTVDAVTTSFRAPTLSPDGRILAYIGADTGQPTLVYLHDLESLATTPVQGTDGALQIAFSSDGDALAFITTQRQLKVADLVRGTVQLVSEDEDIGQSGVAWAQDGYIYFPTRSGNTDLRRARPDGSMVERLPASEESGSAITRSFPFAHGDTIVSTFIGNPLATSDSGNRVRALVLPGGEDLEITTGCLAGKLAGRYFVCARDRELLAARIDPGSLKLQTTPIVVEDGLNLLLEGFPIGSFSLNAQGSLAYVGNEGDPVSSQGELWLLGRNGEVDRRLGTEDRRYLTPAFSPDGQWLAATSDVRPGPSGKRLVRFDVSTGNETPIATSRASGKNVATWQTAGDIILFADFEASAGGFTLGAVSSSGTGEIEQFLEPRATPWWPFALSSDRRALYGTWDTLQLLDLASGKLESIWEKPGYEVRSAGFSPDEQWIVFAEQNLSLGDSQLWIAPLNESSAANQITLYGGSEPIWRQGGIYFHKDNAYYRMDIEPRGPPRAPDSWEPGEVEELFLNPGYQYFGPFRGIRAWDVSPDEERFAVMSGAQPGSDKIVVALDWLKGLDRRLPD